jgi:hypothetical protein
VSPARRAWQAGRLTRRHYRLARAESQVRRGTDEPLQKDSLPNIGLPVKSAGTTERRAHRIIMVVAAVRTWQPRPELLTRLTQALRRPPPPDPLQPLSPRESPGTSCAWPGRGSGSYRTGSARPVRANASRCGECVDHRAGLWPGPVHLRVLGHDGCAHPAQVTFGHTPVEADRGEVIGHEIASPVQRGDQHGIGPDPGREVSGPGVRQHPAPARAWSSPPPYDTSVRPPG